MLQGDMQLDSRLLACNKLSFSIFPSPEKLD